MFNLQEALEAIKGREEWHCNERDFGFVIDYAISMPGTFTGENARQTLILQNLRGTCFDKNGKIIRLAYHKFHNLNEKPEYQAHMFDFKDKHEIQEKLDGSMIAPVPFEDGSYRLGTRAGVTEVAEKAEKFMAAMSEEKRAQYDEFIKFTIRNNVTAMFEYCARDQRIVIDYAESKLVLTALRNNESGRYLDFEGGLKPYLNKLNLIDKVQVIAREDSNISELAEFIRNIKNAEGVVVKFTDGRFVKIKGEEYCLMHRSLDDLRFEKDVLALVLDNKLDDVLPLVHEDKRNHLVAYQESVFANLQKRNAEMDAEYVEFAKIEDRKMFAEAVKDSIYKKNHFARLSGKQYKLEYVAREMVGSSTKVESIRWMIGKSYYEFV